MRASYHPEIRALLRSHPEGLTTNELAELSERISDARAALRSLESMPDAYIDRWVSRKTARGQWQGVWCVVVPPENCPYPKERVSRKTT